MSKNVLGRLHVLLTAESTDFDKKMKEVGDRLKGTGKQLADFGQSMMTRVTLPLVGVGVTALKMGGDFESSMNQVKAVTNATGDEFTALSDQAKLLGRTTQFSASEAADAMYFLASAGFNTTDVMKAMPGVLNLAAAANMDLASATDIASNILSGYGMEVEDLGRVNDVLVKAFQKSNVNVAMLGESMKYAAPFAAAAGIEFEEAAAMVGLFGNAGIQGSQAGTAMRGAISRLIKPAGEAVEVIERLGLQTQDTSGNLVPFVDLFGQLEQAGISTKDLITLFGVEAGPAMAAALQEGSGALATLTDELRNSGGVAEEVAGVQMEGLNGALKGLKSAFEGLMIAIFQSGLGEKVTQFTSNLTSLIQRITELDVRIIKISLAFGFLLAAIGPVLFAVGKLVAFLPTIGAGLAAVKGAVTLVTGAFLGLNPVTLAIMGVVGTLTAGWLLFGDSIKEIAYGILPSLKNAFSSVSGAVEEFKLLASAIGDVFVKNIATPVSEVVGPKLKEFKELLSEIAEFVTGFFVDHFVEAFDNVGKIFETLGGWARKLREVITGEVAPAIAQSTGEMFNDVGGAAKKAADEANAALAGIGGNRVNAQVTTNLAANVISPLAEGAAASNEALTKAAQATDKAAEAIKQYDQALIEGARLQTLTGQEMLQLQQRTEYMSSVLALANTSLEERNQLTSEYNALENARLDVMGVNRDTLHKISTTGMDVSHKLQGLGVEVSAMHTRTREQTGLLGMFGQSIGNAADNFKTSLGNSAIGIVSKFSPMGIAVEVIGRVMEKMRPLLEALEQPLEMLADVIAAALMPILKAMFPVFKLLAVSATYVGQIFFKVAQGIAWAVGNVIKAIGAVVSKIPLMGKIGDNLSKFGSGILDVGKGFGEAADALGDARDEIKALTWPEEVIVESVKPINADGEPLTDWDAAPIDDTYTSGPGGGGPINITIGDVIVDASGSTDPAAVGATVANTLLDMIDQALGYQVSRDTRLDGEMALI